MARQNPPSLLKTIILILLFSLTTLAFRPLPPYFRHAVTHNPFTRHHHSSRSSSSPSSLTIPQTPAEKLKAKETELISLHSALHHWSELHLHNRDLQRSVYLEGAGFMPWGWMHDHPNAHLANSDQGDLGIAKVMKELLEREVKKVMVEVDELGGDAERVVRREELRRGVEVGWDGGRRKRWRRVRVRRLAKDRVDERVVEVREEV